MSKFSLLEELYSLTSQMTVANDYNFDWSSVKSWKNGAAIIEESPLLYIEFLTERNNDAVNGVGNNFQQIGIPMQIKYGKTLSAPSDELEATTYQLMELDSKLEKDIKKMYSSPYKVDISKAPEYCGTEYTGEGELTEAEQDLDGYTVVGSLLFDITFKDDRGINE